MFSSETAFPTPRALFAAADADTPFECQSAAPPRLRKETQIEVDALGVIAISRVRVITREWYGEVFLLADLAVAPLGTIRRRRFLWMDQRPRA